MEVALAGTWWLDGVKRFFRSDCAAYVAVVGLSTLLCLWAGGLGWWNIDVPRAYSADGMCHLAVTKGIIDNGWVFNNPYLGLPFGQHELAFDYPEFLGSSVQLAALKLLSLFSSSPVTVVNLYLLLTFPPDRAGSIDSISEHGILTSQRMRRRNAVRVRPFPLVKIHKSSSP